MVYRGGLRRWAIEIDVYFTLLYTTGTRNPHIKSTAYDLDQRVAWPRYGNVVIELRRPHRHVGQRQISSSNVAGIIVVVATARVCSQFGRRSETAVVCAHRRSVERREDLRNALTTLHLVLTETVQQTSASLFHLVLLDDTSLPTAHKHWRIHHVENVPDRAPGAGAV